MVDAEAQTEPPRPAVVVGVEQDVLYGVRVRKSFGARAFWGSVVGCYWVSGGLFYKVSFDDGDVDIFSADEVLRDAQEAKKHAKENPQSAASADAASSNNNEALDAYLAAMRHHCLKRKRNDAMDCSVPNVRRVQLWGQRLYASIYTNDRNETFIKELLKAEDGGIGEMEATGQVQVGDMILAVNQTRALGMPSRELAELIKKPKRPVTLTFYRPQHPSDQQTQGAQSAPVAAAQPPAPVPAPANVMPPSFVVQPPTFRHPASAPLPPPQWGPLPQRGAISEKEALRQSLLQRVSTQGGYVPGMGTGVMAVPSHGVPVPAGYTSHPQHYVQRIVDAAAMRVSAGFVVPPQQQARPMIAPPPQTSAPASRVDYYNGRNQRQRTAGPTLYQQVQQMQAQRAASAGSNRASSEHTQPRAAPTVNAKTSTAQAEVERRTEPSEPTRNQPNASTSSRQSPHNESAAARSSAERIPTSAPSTSAVMTGPSTITHRDVEAIAVLAERDPKAARRVWSGASSSFLSPSDTPAAKNPAPPTTQSTSFLTPGDEDGGSSFLSPSDTALGKDPPTTSFLAPSSASADKSPTTVERAAETASHSMSFLSPTDFSAEETSTLTRTAPTNSNVSLVTVKVSRRRLYLTLGVQGTLIAVTSFVPDEHGQPGEVELSGKVLPGDVLVRVNATYIRSGMTPSHVADIVNSAPRPMSLWFERASWDVLDGKA